MYPSLNNNGSKPQRSSSLLSDFYNDSINSKAPQEHDHTPTSSSTFLVPSPIYIPLEDEAVFCEFLQQQFFYDDYNHSILAHEMNNNVESVMEELCGNINGQIATNDGHDDHRDFSTHVDPHNDDSTRNRPSKGDRHRKINTPQGPRDRRIRLSHDVAKKLFELQDLLGFDKASKAVDWLLTESKTAILGLFPDRSCSFMRVSNSASSTSECEVMSTTGDDQATTKNKAKSCPGSSKKQKDKMTRVREGADSHHPLAKETRVRARERARERTIEKHKHGVSQDSTFTPCLDQVMDQDINQGLGYWSIFQENQYQSIDQLNHMSPNFRLNQQGFDGDDSSFLITANCTTPYIVLDYQMWQLTFNFLITI
ncbi:hypothetical protein L1987_23299 [Smallanthus sonchifolius]|uniref:Uncharacterized protein n=1 Tax=Smallanthus sonchifolius TaxID=185202 RepID=A0ACB9IJW2_9ASTR|nr:hypothetical protein L1987_23299 [Smallanthus sonchifolius]